MPPFEGPQRMLILGGTGPTGLLGIKIALERGHTVTIYARTPSKLPEEISNNPKATILQGDLSSASVEKSIVPLLSTFDSIVSFLGPNTFPGKDTPYFDFWTFLLPHLRALPSANRPYLVVMHTLSITSPKDASNYLLWLMIFGMRTFGGTVWSELQSMKAMWLAEKEREDGVKWTVSRVGFLQDWEQKGEGARAGYVGKDGWGLKHSRADIAAWSVREAEKREWCGEMPALFSGVEGKEG